MRFGAIERKLNNIDKYTLVVAIKTKIK